MGNDENWVRSLRAAGREYEMTPPAGLWEGIEAELRAASVAGRPNWFVKHGRAIWSAAACMAFAAVAAIYILCGRGGKDVGAPLVVEEPVKEDIGNRKVIENNVSMLNDGELTSNKELPGDGIADKGLIASADRGDEQSLTDVTSGHGYAEFSYYERIVVTGEGGSAPGQGSVMVSATTDAAVTEDTEGGQGVILKETDKGFGGSLYAKISRPKSPYGMPVGAGAAVEIPLSGRLNLETGVEYTGVKAAGRIESYIGVPVKVNYDAYDNGRLRVYASGGGAVEKSLNTRDLQLSVAAGLGAEFSLNEDWGVFVEPSVNYYPGNGNSIPTLYKDRKVSPEVRVGLRHNFRQ